MRALVTLIAATFFAYGLWQHDWHLLAGSLLLAFVNPLVTAEARDIRAAHRHRELLDRLWDDDDLSGSA